MKYEYIGRALSAISKLSHEKADWAACQIGQMGDASLFTLDLHLNHGLLAYTMRNADIYAGGIGRPELADWRRGVQLLQRLNGTSGEVSMDEGECKQLIRTFQPARQLPVSGFYLKASYWAFASSSERAWTTRAWHEGMAALLFGEQTARRAAAAAGGAAGGVGGAVAAAMVGGVAAAAAGGAAAAAIAAAGAAAAEPRSSSYKLVKKWFGATSPSEIARRIKQMRDNATTRLVGICYQGNGANAAGRWPIHMRELADSNIPSDVACASSGWGWSAPQACGNQILGFGVYFFDHHTRKNVVRVHDPAASEMNVTRAGAMLHEMTHRFGNTEDVRVPDAVYRALDKPVPGLNAERARAYGPRVCAALARSSPALAANNADNYRLFCEDALFAKPGN